MIPCSSLLPRLLLGLALLPPLLCAALPEDFDLDAPLPVDPAIMVGELDNGLRYFIKENPYPEGRVSLRLVVNAGSLQEEEDQRGIAHFLEHMAFNGTEHFEKQELVSFLETLGMAFGQHLNASTSFDQTIYQLEVPVGQPGALDKCLLVLEDWASGIRFDPFEIEAERGVIEEEWRSRQGAEERIRNRQYPHLYYGSHYARRLPIGSMFVVKNAQPERFVSFYRDWYRPNLMAVIAVGDFEGKEMERQIVQRFSKLENPADAPERLTYEIPDHEETRFSILSDPELTSASVGVYLKVDPDPDVSARDYRRHMVERVYFAALNRRLEERLLEQSPPYLGAGVGVTKLGREKKAYTMSVGLIEGREMEGLQALYAEVARAARDGLSTGELERVKADIARSMDRFYAERESTDSGVFAEEFTRAFLVGEPIPGIVLEREMTHAFLADMGVDEVNAVGRKFEQTDSRVILYTAPEKDGRSLPSQEDLLLAIEKGRSAELLAYVDRVSDAPLLADIPAPGEIVEEVYHEVVDTYEWRLSNGARVVVKSTDFKKDQILMSAHSEGGHSLVMDDEYVSAITSTMVVGESGLGDFSLIELDKKLAGTSVNVTPSINAFSETLTGSASPEDLEVFFKVLYLTITQPNQKRLDAAFESVRNRVAAMIQNRQQAPQSVFQDAIEKELYGDHPRHRPLGLDLLSEMDAGLSLEVYKDRFQDADDFTFLFVGNIDLDLFREYVKTYVATLPRREGDPEEAAFVGDKPAGGRKVVNVSRGLEEKTAVRVLFMGDADWSADKRLALAMTRDLLSIRLREVLREDHGGVYGVGVFGNLLRVPYGSYSSGFAFSCEPGNVEALARLGLMEIMALQENGPSPINLRKVKEKRLRAFEQGMTDNGYWLGSLLSRVRDGLPFDDIVSYPELIEAFDGAAAQQAAKDYYSMENMLIATLNPSYEQ